MQRCRYSSAARPPVHDLAWVVRFPPAFPRAHTNQLTSESMLRSLRRSAYLRIKGAVVFEDVRSVVDLGTAGDGVVLMERTSCFAAGAVKRGPAMFGN